jgi:hypothetical protein
MDCKNCPKCESYRNYPTAPVVDEVERVLGPLFFSSRLGASPRSRPGAFDLLHDLSLVMSMKLLMRVVVTWHLDLVVVVHARPAMHHLPFAVLDFAILCLSSEEVPRDWP